MADRLTDDLFENLVPPPTGDADLLVPQPSYDPDPYGIRSGKPSKKKASQPLYKPVPMRHPTWRVYKALRSIGASVLAYGLPDIEIFYPTDTDPYIEQLIALFSYIQDYRKANKATQSIDFSKFSDTIGIVDPYETFIDDNMRAILEDLFMTGRPIAEIVKVVACDEKFLLDYRSAFFDTSILRDNRDIIQYIMNCTDATEQTRKKVAMESGLNYVTTKYGMSANNNSDVDAILKDAFNKSYLRFLDASTKEGLDDQESAQGWAKVMVQFATQLAKTTSTNVGAEDVRITLRRTHAPTVGINDLK